MLDRILRLEYNSSITAIKNVSLGEDVYADHFFGFPVMPGALQIEAFAQAGSALVEVSTAHRKKAFLLMVEQAKFRGMVRPGDQLTIDMTVLSMDSSSARLEGTIHANGALVTTGRIVLGLGDPEVYYPRPTRHLIESIYRIWLDGTIMEGFDTETAGPDSPGEMHGP